MFAQSFLSVRVVSFEMINKRKLGVKMKYSYCLGNHSVKCPAVKDFHLGKYISNHDELRVYNFIFNKSLPVISLLRSIDLFNYQSV